MKTSAQALEQVIADRIEDVQFWIDQGMSKASAIAKVKSESSLGSAPWTRIEEAV
jgi:hypothetical protein